MTKRLALGGIAATAIILSGSLSPALAGSHSEHRAAPEPVTHIVEIRQFKFTPAEITVKPGDTIRWVNMDAAPHTATAGDQAWDSSLIKRNNEWSYTPTKVGRSEYICTFHPVMRGVIIVADNP